jgi:hypothetical protein
MAVGGPSSSELPDASPKDPEPRKPTRSKPQKTISWVELTADLLGDVPTSAASDLNYSINRDRILLVLNKPRLERNLSEKEIQDLGLQDFDGSELSTEHGLSIEPEILRVIYRRYVDSLKSRPAIDRSLSPLHNIKEIFDDIAEKADSLGFGNVLSHLGSRKLRVATMCSGTESPLLALKMFGDSTFKNYGHHSLHKLWLILLQASND